MDVANISLGKKDGFMQILFNPDIAYLILVASFVLIMLAVITPGTGILEIAAVFILLTAAYSIIQIPLNLWALLVIVCAAGLFVLAVWRTKHLLTLAIALILFVFGSAYLFRGQNWWQPAVNPLLATFVSALVVGFFWIAGRKAIEASQIIPRHELTQLIGAIGEAKTEIHKSGTVQVESELWSAYSKSPIPKGSRVRVINRDGFLLEVVKEEDQQTS